MHQHLGKIGAMRLILGQRQDQLRGAADSVLVLGDDNRALAGLDAPGDAAPEGNRLVAREGMHETDRRAAVDHVHQYIREAFDLRIANGMQAADLKGGHDVLSGLAMKTSRPNASI